MSRDEAVARIAALAQGSTPVARRHARRRDDDVRATRRAFSRARRSRRALALRYDRLLLASRARHGPLRERVTGIDLIEPLVERSAVGRRSAVLSSWAALPASRSAPPPRCAQRHPNAAIAGTRDGYFTPDENPTIVASIARQQRQCSAGGTRKSEARILAAKNIWALRNAASGSESVVRLTSLRVQFPGHRVCGGKPASNGSTGSSGNLRGGVANSHFHGSPLRQRVRP